MKTSHYILTKRETWGNTPDQESKRKNKPGDGGDDSKGITALMGKLGQRGARVNLINLERTHGTSLSHKG